MQAERLICLDSGDIKSENRIKYTLYRDNKLERKQI